MKFLSQINVNTEYTLPMVDGTNGQVLSTDGNGVAYWGTISAGSLTLDGLSDVIITSPSSDQMLRYGLRQGDTVPVWHNFTPNFLTPSSSIDALNDVVITTAAAGQLLRYNGSNWVNWTPNFLTAHPSILAASSVNNSNGTVIQDITLEANGHVTGLTSVDLDTRYYTESEIDSLFAGETEIDGYNRGAWDIAYNDKINSASFSTTTGVLTLTQQDTGTVTVDLDGRYLQSYTETDTLSSVTGRGNTTTNHIGVTTASPINFFTAGNLGTWLGGIQDSNNGWSISNNGLGLKADNTTYSAIVMGPANGLIYFGRTMALGAGTMATWLEVNSSGTANFKLTRPQHNGNNLALLSEIPTDLNQLTNTPGYITGISFANVSSKPTTIAGYGITDAITTTNIGNQSVAFATVSRRVIDTPSARITTPEGAYSVGNSSGTGGAIKISLPTTVYNNNTMMSMTVEVYLYSTGQSFTLRIGGYNYYDGTWYNVFASILSDSGKSTNVPVYFGNNGVDRNVIWIGDSNSTWDYPNVFVTDFQSGHSQNQDWARGWSVSFSELEQTNVTASRIAYRQVDAGNIGSYALTSLPAHTHTIANVTDLQTALDGKVPTTRTLTINGTAFDLSANRSWTISTTETDTLATVTGRGDSTTTALYLTGGSGQIPALHIRSGGSSWSEGLAIHPSTNNGYALSFYRTRASYTDQTNTWGLGNLGDANALNHFGLLRNGLTGGIADRSGDAVFTINPTGVFKFGFNPYVGGNVIWHAGNDGDGSGLDADSVDGVHASNIVWGNAKGTNDSVTTDADGLDKTGFYTSSGFVTRPESVENWMYIQHIKLYNSNSQYQKQIGYDTYDDRMWVRTKSSNTWSSWKAILTSDNIGEYALTSLPAHTHTIANVTGLQTALDGKAASSHTHAASDITSGTISTDRLPKQELGISIAGNFGQWEPHGTYTNFNTDVVYWGWSYVQGTGNAPHTTSSQWYRGRFSLGSQYGLGSGGGDYWMEIAIPRYSQGNNAGNLFVRTAEDGVATAWQGVRGAYSTNAGYAISSGNSETTDQTNFTALSINNAAVATEEFVASQGYITGSYLPLSGGTLSGAVVVNLGNVSSDTVAFKVGGPSNYDSLTIGMEDTPDYDAFIASYGNDIRFYSGKGLSSENHSFYWFTSKAGTAQHSVVAMQLDHNQNLTIGGTFTEQSSIRYKENVKSIPSVSQKVEKLDAVSYNKIGSNQEEIGLIAEDVAELFPEVVKYDNEGRPDGVNYSRLSVILLKAVQELTERVNKLENK